MEHQLGDTVVGPSIPGARIHPDLLAGLALDGLSPDTLVGLLRYQFEDVASARVAAAGKDLFETLGSIYTRIPNLPNLRNEEDWDISMPGWLIKRVQAAIAKATKGES